MPDVNWLSEPQWLLTLAALGWGLGWLAVRDRRWAAVPAVTTMLALTTWVVARILEFSVGNQGRPAAVVACALGLGLFVVVPRLPDLRVRTGLAALLVPFTAYHLLSAAGLLFLSVAHIP